MSAPPREPHPPRQAQHELRQLDVEERRPRLQPVRHRRAVDLHEDVAGRGSRRRRTRGAVHLRARPPAAGTARRRAAAVGGCAARPTARARSCSARRSPSRRAGPTSRRAPRRPSSSGVYQSYPPKISSPPSPESTTFTCRRAYSATRNVGMFDESPNGSSYTSVIRAEHRGDVDVHLQLVVVGARTRSATSRANGSSSIRSPKPTANVLHGLRRAARSSGRRSWSSRARR